MTTQHIHTATGSVTYIAEELRRLVSKPPLGFQKPYRIVQFQILQAGTHYHLIALCETAAKTAER